MNNGMRSFSYNLLIQGIGGNVVTFKERRDWIRLDFQGKGAYAECFRARAVETGLTFCVKQVIFILKSG